jgi:Ca2+/H+ antiporter
MSARLGQTLAGLLNASFGNAVEIIVGVAALLQGAWRLLVHALSAHSGFRSGELRIVQTSVSNL